MYDEIQAQLAALSNPEDARFLQGYFKTGPGQYGEGDIFRGIRVPRLRKLAKSYREISLENAERLLRSKYHEDRLLALLILILKYAGADEAGKTRIYEMYLSNTRFINNWDLVDLSAGNIVGAYLEDKDKEPLYRLARSGGLWERRIAILSSSRYIGKGKFEVTLRIAEMLLEDKEDLIHKAVGWMLREVGKRDLQKEESFLMAHYRKMPRTMLRYAIERFPPDRRQEYLKGRVKDQARNTGSPPGP